MVDEVDRLLDEVGLGDVDVQRDEASDRGCGRCSSSEPVSRLSTQITRCSRASSSSQRWDPRKPAPPVTRHVAIAAAYRSERLEVESRGRRRRAAGQQPATSRARCRSATSTSQPSRRLAIVTCMDSRLDVFAALGLARRRGARAAQRRRRDHRRRDPLARGLAAAAGDARVMLIHHTDCGMSKLTDDGFRSELRAGDGRCAGVRDRVLHRRRRERPPVGSARSPLGVPAPSRRGPRLRLRRRHPRPARDRGAGGRLSGAGGRRPTPRRTAARRLGLRISSAPMATPERGEERADDRADRRAGGSAPLHRLGDRGRDASTSAPAVRPASSERPGEFPYTRGIHPDMYRKRLWTMRQYAGLRLGAQESNARYHYLLEHGSTGLSMAFDLPTQLGLDSDDPRCLGEVGRTGVAIDTIDDMRTAFDGIPLDEVSTSMTINAPAARAAAASTSWSARSRASRRRSCAARPRTTSSRSTSRAATTSTRPGRRCG